MNYKKQPESRTTDRLTQQPKKPHRNWLWMIVILVLIIGGIAAFELGKATRQTTQQTNNESDSVASHSVTKKVTQKQKQVSSSSSSTVVSSSSSSSQFQMNDQNTSAAGWYAAAVYYGAHALGYSEIVPDLNQGSFELNDIRGSNGPLGDDGSYFQYHFSGDRSQLNQVVYMGFTFNNKQINYYDVTSGATPAHTVSLQQVLDYINSQNAGRQVENLNCHFIN